MFESDSTCSEQRPTRKLTPLEIEELCEPERRYKPEPGELLDDDVEEIPSAPAPEAQTQHEHGAATVNVAAPCARQNTRPYIRTVRMRVMNFKPLTRPATDEVTSTPRPSVATRLGQLFCALFAPTRFDE